MRIGPLLVSGPLRCERRPVQPVKDLTGPSFEVPLGVGLDDVLYTWDMAGIYPDPDGRREWLCRHHRM